MLLYFLCLIIFDFFAHLFLSNSASRALICAAVNAVRGLFFRSMSSPTLVGTSLKMSKISLTFICTFKFISSWISVFFKLHHFYLILHTFRMIAFSPQNINMILAIAVPVITKTTKEESGQQNLVSFSWI